RGLAAPRMAPPENLDYPRVPGALRCGVTGRDRATTTVNQGLRGSCGASSAENTMLQSLRNLFGATRAGVRVRRACRPTLERFESRDLPSAGPLLTVSAHQLILNGTQGNDQASVRQVGSRLIATLDGHTRSFAASSVKTIAFNGG